uniref:Uncharacterized protein n=1 Tax=Rhizophora mucronata TaxID=61149 RepID=A0A2P2QG38_RHIMU
MLLMWPPFYQVLFPGLYNISLHSTTVYQWLEATVYQGLEAKIQKNSILYTLPHTF